MRLKPGGFLWLVSHDLRLGWRGYADMFGSSGARTPVLVLIGAAFFLNLGAWPAVLWLAPMLHGTDARVLPMAAAVGAVFSWMVAQSLFGATRTLYDRADLDLLLGSPLSAGQIVAAKALALAAGTFSSLALIVLPIADAGMILDRTAWIGVYPALLGLALIATSLGLALAMALFLLAGPRRARMYAQVLGAGLGGAFVLGAQIVAMLPAATRADLSAAIAKSGLLPAAGTHPLLLLPVHAAQGQLPAMVGMLLLGAAVFAATTSLLGKRFAIAAIAAAGASAEHQAGEAGGSRLRFWPGPARNLRSKEMRLLRRDPSLFAQLGLQIVYTIPIAVILVRSHVVPTAVALVPTIVMIAAQVAGSIAWVTVSGEDAPELIASAPVSPAAVDRAKLSAVIPAVMVILALPLLGLATISWPLALVAALVAAMAGTSTALLNFWHPMPGNRRGMLRRHQQSRLIGLVEHALAMLWAFAAVFAMLGTVLTLVPIGIVVAILAFARSRHLGTAAGPVPALRPATVA